ncbi:hypothetical protein BH09PLA1_BH09PLA1_27500 [soil metagenome]
MGTQFRARAHSLLFFACFFASSLPGFASQPTPIAYTGLPAPNAGSGVTFLNFDLSRSSIAPDGSVGFKATLAGPGLDLDTGISFWSGSAPDLAMLARVTQPAPGVDGATFISMGGNNTVGDGGVLSFNAALAGPGINNNNSGALWSGGPGNVQLLARQGSPIAGVSTGVIAGVGNSRANQHGQVTFFANLRNTGVTEDQGIWTGTPGAVQLLARKGAAAPGTSFFFKDFGDQNPPTAINAAGVNAFFASTTQVLPDTSNAGGIWIGTPGSLQLSVTAGTHVDGLPAGLSLAGAPQPRLNDAGQLGFFGRLSGPALDPTNDQAIITGGGVSGTPLRFILREGDQVPGAAPGRRFKNIGAFSMNNHGEIAVGSETTGEPLFASVLVEGGPGDVQLVVSSHTDAPGSTSTFKTFGTTALNDQRMLVFQAGLENGKNGIWMSDESHVVAPVLVSGQSIEVAGSMKTVSITALPFEHSLTDAGTLIFGAVFTDGSQAIFTTTVPEPGSILLLPLIALGAAALRKRSRR